MSKPETRRVVISKRITLVSDGGVPILWSGPSRYELSQYEASRLYHALGELIGEQELQNSAEETRI